MRDNGTYSRRRFLALAAASAGVAGCTSGDGGTTVPESGTEPTTTPESEPESTPTRPGPDAPTTRIETVADSGVEIRRNVTFREGEDWLLLADIYLPESSNAPFVVFAHGGGWFTGDKGRRPMHPAMAEAGIAVADVQYRLVPDFRYPAAVRDVAAAVRWVRANAADYGIDADRGALAGYSAGAHLAALVGLAPEHPNFQPEGFHPDEPVAVDAIVGYSGPYDFTVPGAGENGMVAGFFGEDATDETLREGSPTTHVDAGDPPTLLVHGTADNIVPYRSSTLLATELERVGVPAEVLTGEGAGHGMIDSPEWREETIPTQRAFLREHLDLV